MGNDTTDAAQRLRALGLRGVLVTMAERGQLMDIRCEMPTCYCQKGRYHFDPKTAPMTNWAPNSDHYPRLKRDGGHLVPENVRLAHVFCNRVDYGWRTKIKAMLQKGRSLEAIADALMRQGVQRPHGSPRWTAELVRAVYVS